MVVLEILDDETSFYRHADPGYHSRCASPARSSGSAPGIDGKELSIRFRVGV